MSAPTLRTVASPDALDQIEDALAGLWTLHPHVPEDVRIRLGIAVSEIAANIIEHATAAVGRLVRLQMWAHVRENDLLIKFTDDGIPMSADLPSGDMPAGEMPDELAERGRGLALARAVLNRLTYHRADDVNHWELLIDHR
jgi:serine/threonine-protein kinase RsbW